MTTAVAATMTTTLAITRPGIVVAVVVVVVAAVVAAAAVAAAVAAADKRRTVACNDNCKDQQVCNIMPTRLICLIINSSVSSHRHHHIAITMERTLTLVGESLYPKHGALNKLHPSHSTSHHDYDESYHLSGSIRTTISLLSS